MSHVQHLGVEGGFSGGRGSCAAPELIAESSFRMLSTTEPPVSGASRAWDSVGVRCLALFRLKVKLFYNFIRSGGFLSPSFPWKVCILEPSI